MRRVFGMSDQSVSGEVTRSWHTYSLIAGILLVFGSARWWELWQALVVLGGVGLLMFAALFVDRM